MGRGERAALAIRLSHHRREFLRGEVGMVLFPRAAAAVAVSLICGASAGCVDISAGENHYVETVEKSFPVSGTPTVKLGTFDGSVAVATWDRPEVLVVVEKRAMDRATADRMVVNATQDGDRIEVDVQDERSRGLTITFGPHSARLIVTVPARAQIEARTGDGRVLVQGVHGDLTVVTGDGSIELAQVNGAVDATSGDGSVEIDGAIRTLRARSGDGRVRVRVAAGTSPSGAWSVATGDGSVLLELPDGFGAELDASTGDGRVSVSDLPFSAVDEDRRRVARGRIGAGGPSLRVRSGDGSITVRRAGTSS
jgi:hypothetical protein